MILAIHIANPSSSFGKEIKNDHFNLLSEYKNFSFFDDIDSISSLFSIHEIKKEFPLKTEDLTAFFSLAKKDFNAFSITLPPDMSKASEDNKDYFKPTLEIGKINLIVWAFDKYILNESWANISLRSISENLKHGYSWDYDDFATNYFGHAYHGAMYHSSARFHGLSFVESSAYTLFGSLMWEFFWESKRPSRNDSIMSTFGGMALGEALFKIVDLLTDEYSTGFGRALRKSLRFLINPAVGTKEFTADVFKTGNHYYSLRLPLGAYRSSDKISYFLIETNLIYEDVFKNKSEINPYDWFSFDARLGINDSGLQDPEIYTYGILFGQKIKNRLTGLFGLFDYIDTHIADKMSVVGIGPGFVTSSGHQTNLFFNSSGVLSLIFGGSSASIDFENPHFDKESRDPYHFGPGILGRIKLELGKKYLGSIHTGFSRYWIHSLVADANEFMSIISFDINFDLSNASQISLGYDYYLRNANNQDQHVAIKKDAVRAMYVLNF